MTPYAEVIHARPTRVDWWARRLIREYEELHAGLLRRGATDDQADRICRIYIDRRIAAIPARRGWPSWRPTGAVASTRWAATSGRFCSPSSGTDTRA